MKGQVGKAESCPQCARVFVQSQWPRVYCNRVCAQKAFEKAEQAYVLAGKDMSLAIVEVKLAAQ
jgi:ferredoxin